MVGFFNHLVHQLRQSLAIQRAGDSLHMSTLPAGVRTMLERAGCMKPNDCYRNCGKAISELVSGASYVLCRVSCEGSIPQGHAVMKIGRHYYDPTREGKPCFHGTKYVFQKAFSRKEFSEFVRKEHSNSTKNARGEVEITPPILHMDGTIACKEDPNAPYTPLFMKHN